MDTDQKIIKKFVNGDLAAFDQIYDLYSRKIFYFALGLIKDKDNAKDLVQEVFITLWEKRSYVNPDLNFGNYIFTITYNSVRKYFRRKSIEIRVKEHLLNSSPELINDSDNKLIYNELIELANKSVNKLSPKRKIVYKLSRNEGMKIKEIATRLNISPRTAENHLAQALKFLKKELSQYSLAAILFFYLFLS